jgi:hypothetical protein
MAALFHGEKTRTLLLRVAVDYDCMADRAAMFEPRMRIAKRAQFHQARWRKPSLVRRPKGAAHRFPDLAFPSKS